MLAQARHDGNRHTKIRVVAASAGTLRPLQVTGLDNEVEICPTLHQALPTTR